MAGDPETLRGDPLADGSTLPDGGPLDRWRPEPASVDRRPGASRTTAPAASDDGGVWLTVGGAWLIVVGVRLMVGGVLFTVGGVWFTVGGVRLTVIGCRSVGGAWLTEGGAWLVVGGV